MASSAWQVDQIGQLMRFTLHEIRSTSLRRGFGGRPVTSAVSPISND